MKVSKADLWVTGSYMVGIVLVIGFSWLASMYGGSGRNLMSVEGVRHAVKYALRDYTDAYVAPLLFFSAIWGLFEQSGIGGLLCTRHLSFRQRSAIGVTLFVFVLYLFLFLLGLFLPNAVLLGVTGHIERSVLSGGWLLVLGLGLLLTGVVYGSASGTFRHFRDIIEAMSGGLSQFSPCFIALFCGVQLMSCIDYAHSEPFLLDGSLFSFVRAFILLLPFAVKVASLLFMRKGK